MDNNGVAPIFVSEIYSPDFNQNNPQALYSVCVATKFGSGKKNILPISFKYV